MPEFSHGLSLRHQRSRDPCCRICTGDRVHSYRQAAVFVYDIADIFKFETVVPVAFRIAARNPNNPERDVRLACRGAFRQSKVLQRIIPTIEHILAAGGLEKPKPPEESVEPAIPNKEGIGDAGHRG